MKHFFAIFLCLALSLSAEVGMIPRLGLKHREADGVGYRGGYTTFEGMFGFPIGERHVPFINGRLHAMNRGKLAGNVGAGYRYNFANSDMVLGVNGYYDQRSTPGIPFKQFGVGLEFLSSILDFRANGYFPVWTTKDIRSARTNGFIGNQLLLNVRERMALTGVDGEFGTCLGGFGETRFYGAVGSYFFKRQSCNTKFGFKSRIKASWRDNLWAEASFFNDDLFHSNFQGTVGISFPFWSRSGPKCRPSNSKRTFFPCRQAMLIQPVERQEIVVLCQQRRNVIAQSAEGQELFFIFVDNTSGSDGTFEDPFPALKTAEGVSSPGDFIYVLSGDGTTAGMDMGIVLQNDQSLLGGGIDQTIDTQFGPLVLPAQSPQNPMITNTAGDCVVLADGTRVSGFDIPSPSAHGLSGTNVAGVIIERVAVTAAGTHGLDLVSNAGETTTVEVRDSSFNGGASHGVCGMSSNNSTIDIGIFRSDCVSNAGDGIVLLGTDSSHFDANVQSCSINNNTMVGFDLDGMNTTFNVTINDTQANGNTLQGIHLAPSASVAGSLTLTSSTISNNTSHGMEVDADSSSIFTFTAQGCTINSNGSDGVNLHAQDGSTFTFNMSNNTLDGNTADGLDFLIENTSTFTGTIDNNTITNCGSNGVDIETENSSISTFTVTNNTIDTCGSDCINVLNENSAMLTGTITGNTLRNATLIGLDLETENSTAFVMTASNNTIDTTGTNGLEFRTETTSTTTGTFDGNTITGTGAAAFEIDNLGSSTVTAIVRNHTVTGNSGDGFNIRGQTDAVIASLVLSGNTVSGNTGRGIFVNGNSDASFTVTLEDNTVQNNGGDGIFARSINTAVCSYAINDNTCSGNGGTDIETRSANTASLCLQLLGNTSGNGYFLDHAGGSTFSVESPAPVSIASVEAANTGTPFTADAAVTPVALGTCGFP